MLNSKMDINRGGFKMYRQKAMSLEYEMLRFMCVIWFCSLL